MAKEIGFPIQWTGRNYATKGTDGGDPNANIEGVYQYAVTNYPGGGWGSTGVGYFPSACTWWCWARSKWVGGIDFGMTTAGNKWGNAYDWYLYAKSLGILTNTLHKGDIIVFGYGSTGQPGHVAFVEEVYSNGSIRVSEGATGSNHERWISVSNRSYTPGNNHWLWSGDWFAGIIRNPCSGGGGEIPDPVDPDKPPASGYSLFRVTYQNVSFENVSLDYTDIYECGVGTFGDQSGTQDEPLAPTKISQSTSRLNQRWEPFNMYTYERLLTYDSKKDPVWSGWDLKYDGSENFPLGNQPSMNNGWQIDWEDGG